VTKEDPKKLRLLFTLLQVRRAWDIRSSPDLLPIQQRSFATDFSAGRLRSVVKELGWNLGEIFWEAPHLSTKAGPNGLAMITSLEDIKLIPSSLEGDIKLIGGSDFTAYFDQMKSISHLPWSEALGLAPVKGLIRKLSTVNDPEGKCRIIAILDYWSQTALIPLHKGLFRLLKRIKADCTFSQHNLRTLKKGPYYSIDLSSATDRFPIQSQKAVLAALVSDEYAEA